MDIASIERHRREQAPGCLNTRPGAGMTAATSARCHWSLVGKES